MWVKFHFISLQTTTSVMTNHAIIQSLFSNVVRGIPQPCCTADVMETMTLLLLDTDGNVSLRSYPDINTTSCKCRWADCDVITRWKDDVIKGRSWLAPVIVLLYVFFYVFLQWIFFTILFGNFFFFPKFDRIKNL